MAERITLARAIELGGLALAALPPVYLLAVALSNDPLPDNDYWRMFRSVIGPDGEFTPAGLLAWQHEHLQALPKAVFALNAILGDGSNRALGFLVWGISLAVAVLLWRALPSRSEIGGPARALLAVVVSAGVFTPHAVHNFVLGMSGTAWIGANLLSIVAVALAARGRTCGATVAAIAAAASYGTGLAAWPAVVIALAVARRRLAPALVPAVAGLVAAAIYLALYQTPPLHPKPVVDPLALGHGLLVLLGAPLAASAPVAAVLGAAAAGSLGFAVARTWSQDVRRLDAFWLGVAVYGLGACGTIALARAGYGPDAMLSSRYATLPALALAAAAVLWVRSGAGDRVGGLTVLAVATLLSVTTASGVVRSYAAMNEEKRLLSASLWLGDAGLGTASGVVFFAHTEAERSHGLAALRAVGAYPFDGDFPPAACRGPLDGDGSAVVAGLGVVDTARPVQGSGLSLLTGWAVVDGRPAACIRLIDEAGAPAGFGFAFDDRPDVARAVGVNAADLGWRGVAVGDPARLRAFAVSKAGRVVGPLTNGLPDAR